MPADNSDQVSAVKRIPDVSGLLHRDGPAVKRNRGRWGEIHATAETDADLIVGRKGVLEFLKLRKWRAVVDRIRLEGLPVDKIGGRIEMSKAKYRQWRQNLPAGKGIIE